MFVQAAVEELPVELERTATEVFVQFPWGSLLRGVASGDPCVMSQIRNICSADAQLNVTIGLDAERDKAEWERLGLEPPSLDYIKTVLAVRYRDAGFSMVNTEQLSSAEFAELQTSWARRLRGNASRSLIKIAARAIEVLKARHSLA